MKSGWAFFSLSPLSLYVLTYFLQVVDFLLISSTLRYFLYDPHQGLLHIKASETERVFLVVVSTGIIFKAGQALFTTYLGAVSDWFGRRKALLLSQGFWILGFFICALGVFFFYLPLFAAGRLLMGGAAPFYPIALSTFCDLFEDPRQRMRAFGIFSAVQGIFVAVSTALCIFLLTPSLNPISSPHIFFALAGIVSIFNFLLIYTNLPETNRNLHFSIKNWLFCTRNLFSLLREYQIKPILFFYFFSVLSISTTAFMCAKDIFYLFSQGNTSLIFLGIYALAWVLSSALALPYLSGRISARNAILPPWIVLAISILSRILLPTPLLSVLSLLMTAVASALTWPFLLWMVGTIAPDLDKGKALSLAHAASALAMIFGPFTAGSFLPSEFLAPILSAFLILISTLFFLFGSRLRPEICGPLKSESSYAG
jgi:MFS family permease